MAHAARVTPMETADVIEAPPAFGACLACHNITGTNAALPSKGWG